jgi:hypothetical protein
MDNKKKIEKFVSRSIKTCLIVTNDSELRDLLEQMTTEELNIFWASYSGGEALSESNRVPYWKSKEQEQYFIQRCNHYAFYPKEKDANGKCVIDREDLINHIVERILTKTNNSIKRDIDFKNRSLFERLPYYLSVSPIYVIPIFALLVWLSSGIIRNIAIVILACDLFVTGIAYNIINSLIRKKNKRNVNQGINL